MSVTTCVALGTPGRKYPPLGHKSRVGEAMATIERGLRVLSAKERCLLRRVTRSTQHHDNTWEMRINQEKQEQVHIQEYELKNTKHWWNKLTESVEADSGERSS